MARRQIPEGSMASEAEVAAFVAAMPKCELHVHLEGAMTPAMKLTLAARNGIDLKFATTQEIEASYLGIHDTPAFLSAYYAGVELLQTASDFYEVARGFFETLAAEHVRYVELSFDPQAHTSRRRVRHRDRGHPSPRRSRRRRLE